MAEACSSSALPQQPTATLAPTAMQIVQTAVVRTTDTPMATQTPSTPTSPATPVIISPTSLPLTPTPGLLQAVPTPYAVSDPTKPQSPWISIQIPGQGGSFEVPKEWKQVGSDWAWSPNDSGWPRVGLKWSDVGPGWQPTMMLPDRSQVLQSTPTSLNGITATLYTLEVTGAAPHAGVQTRETHVVAHIAKTRAYDFWASGRSLEELETARLVLQHMLTSVRLFGDPGPRP